MKYTEEELKKHFEEKYLKGTCFDFLRLKNYLETTRTSKPTRALIAANLGGVWQGLQELLGGKT